VGEVRRALAGGDAGMLVEAGDAGQLAAALEDLLADASRARDLAARARTRAAAEYDVSHMVRRYGSLYTRLFARAS